MTRPEIIGSERSTYTRVVRMVCEEKGIDYDLTEALLGAAEIRALHPFGKMPVLRHGDLVLCESKAIATYLDRRFPGPAVFPSDPHLAALTEQWVSFVNTSVDRTLIRTYLFAYIVPKGPDGTPDRAVAATGHLVGGEFSFADINLLPILFYIRQTPEGGEALAGAPHLSAYYDVHAARPCFARTVPPVGPPRRTTPN